MKNLTLALVLVLGLVGNAFAEEKTYEELMDENVTDGVLDIDKTFDADTADYIKSLIQ